MNVNSTRILVVEDENIVAKDIRSQLNQIGYTSVQIANTGEEALIKVEEQAPDLLLLDIMLSRGTLDGIETAILVNEKADIPIIYLTAYANDSSWIRTKVTRPYGYILKPFQILDLKIAIEFALNNHTLEKRRKRNRTVLSAILNPDCAILKL